MTQAKLQERFEDAEVTRITADDIILTQNTATDISLNLDRSDVVDLTKKGNDLVVELANGEVIVIKDFYTANEDGKKNRLFLSDDEVIAQIDTANLDGVNFIEAGAEFEPLVFGHDLGIITPLLGAIGAGGAVAAAVGSGGSDEPATVDAPIIDSVNTNPDGTLSIVGTG